ncbi:hypothetical protein GLOTRDRAFT_38224 [Gloeophyllum trabeum ATCC 11539]|uniref:Uncharacterized protein n=1 Tax=Gloeophyllum trabeum (strain ATCC 11539 / FP-39264 / Madison 617) TaxID=670483 RepID=S7QCK4_GLOTA|nr:uncharacterized protein GLOTRDRAFT_38224 [Gloeophyllum trabeum ATCC 11539]EPQ57611.1 hypothetical protein GLOTRDRAFT_38224 [Gloeophyllum trabeum ATCC 11539]
MLIPSHFHPLDSADHDANNAGAYCILFLAASHILLRRKRGHRLRDPLVWANTALFLTCSAHFALEFNHFHTTLAATGVPGYANETKPLFAADLFISLADLLGDFVLIYRCYLVWGRAWWVTVLPTLTAVAGFACIMELLHLLLSINPSSPTAPPQIVPLGIAGYVLPLSTNVFVTALIAARIFWIARASREYSDLTSSAQTVHRAINVVVESGALYLAVQLTFVVLFAMQHPAQAILAVIAVQVYVSLSPLPLPLPLPRPR